MTILTIIQARTGSTRLPGKALKPIRGLPILAHVIDAAPYPCIVACPQGDLAIRDVAIDQNVAWASAPNPDDVLTRFIVALKKAERIWGEFTHILRLTADCPMLTRKLIDAFLDVCVDSEPDSITSNRPLDPDGIDMEHFSVALLRQADKHATSPYAREHVTPWIYTHARCVHKIRVSNLSPMLKLSVDTMDDYNRVKTLMEVQ